MALEIEVVPVLTDNYMFLLHDPESGDTACVDPAEAGIALAAASTKGWTINKILITHKHNDHIGGLADLKAATGAFVLGPRKEAEQIAALDQELIDGDEIKIGSSRARVIETPGHTLGHIVYHFAEDNALIAGDALFVLGCGRLFEGEPAQMWRYLKVLRNLPEKTRVYCGHEYTQANLKFMRAIDPHSESLTNYAQELKSLREKKRPSVPSTIAFERRNNMFLQADEPGMDIRVNRPGASPEEVFAALRAAKDRF